MTNRRMHFLAFAAVALVSLFLPATASAQRPWWERDRDDDHRHERDDDHDRHQPGRISDQERRILRDVARRIDDRSRSFERNLDRLLDDSRYDDTRREDHINNDVDNFRRAAERFKGRAGDSNDLNRSANEARQLLDTAAHVGTYLRRVRMDSRTSNDWQQIRADLRTVADIYGFRNGDFGGYGRGRNDDYGRGRRRDDDDDYRRDRDRDRRRDNNTGWRWPRNLPFPN